MPLHLAISGREFPTFWHILAATASFMSRVALRYATSPSCRTLACMPHTHTIPYLPMHAPVPWKREELARTAHDKFNSRTCPATSRQHSVLVWFALREQQGQAIHEHRTAGLNAGMRGSVSAPGVRRASFFCIPFPTHA